MMHGRGKSETLVVPKNLPNKGSQEPTEAGEERSVAKGNADPSPTSRTQSRTDVPSARERVRQAARRDRRMRFTALFHHLTIDLLREAFLALRRGASAGVDGLRWDDYAQDLEGNLAGLHARLHRGAYRAKPSRRVFIPKSDGQQRPLGIAALEDKLVQRAVVSVLNAIYEEDFLGFSYGFRPGRGPHQALDALAVGIKRRRVNWVLDADIKDFYGTIDHGWLLKFLEHRIGDRRMLRLIQKWLNAGVLERGQWKETEQGVPQGAPISCLLANVYLHYVFDLWTQQWRKKHARGEVIVVRYADDVALGFEHDTDARRYQEALRQRLQPFGLSLHEGKTRILRFGRFARDNCRERDLGKPESFDFLGFTHLCGVSRAGGFVLLRWSSAKRMQARLRGLREELKRRRHQPVSEQGAWLQRVVRGWFAYYAVPTNTPRLWAFRYRLAQTWRRALGRRSQRARVQWERMAKLVDRWLPLARVSHPWPEARFDARTQGKSPVR